MDLQTLSTAMGNLPTTEYERFVGPLNEALFAAECTTVNRVAMWCAQVGHESGGLRYMEEIADGSAYEGRLDLGNTQPGDGRRFKGRGPIQLTGRENYRRFSVWAHSKGLVPTEDHFLTAPTLVSDPKWGFLAASYYWTVARPKLNELSDASDIEGATKAVNGGLNGLPDRTNRWNRCRALGAALLPTTIERKPAVEKVLDYPRIHIKQDTFFNCGPASTQTVIIARTGGLILESDLGHQMGTDQGGTDHIGLVAPVLNKYVSGADYRVVQMPNDPPTKKQAQKLWDDVVRSIDNGYGVVANIVAPPSNYPRGVRGSVSPQYAGGTVFHYIAIMGYADDNGARAFWVADSGFVPYGYWCSFEQMASLIPPKGYTTATGGHLIVRVGEIWAQLVGINGKGWPQLGGRTLVDAVATLGQDMGIAGFGPPAGHTDIPQRATVDDCVLDIWTQLIGINGKGWPQLAGRTLVDAVATLGQAMGIAAFVPPAEHTGVPETSTTANRVLDIWIQLLGINGKGWPQLGGRTLVDAVATLGQEMGLVAFVPPAGHTNVPQPSTTDSRVLDIWIQLLGFDGKGWPQLNRRTPVDGIATIGQARGIPGFTS